MQQNAFCNQNSSIYDPEKKIERSWRSKIQDSRRTFQTVTSFESRKLFVFDGTVFQSLNSDKKKTQDVGLKKV